MSTLHDEILHIARCLADANKRLRAIEEAPKKEYATPLDLHRMEERLVSLARELGKLGSRLESEDATRHAFAARAADLRAEFSAKMDELGVRIDAKEFEAAKGLTPRGEWEQGMTLNRLDVVTVNGSSYLVLADGVKDKPTSRNKTLFQLLARRGGGGSVGTISWGQIVGSIADQTDLVAYLNSGYQPLSAPLTSYANAADDAARRALFTAIGYETNAGSFTAKPYVEHVVTATGTVADPSPSQGVWFRVFVRNGTATVGGVAYSTPGTLIERVYHSGAWATYPVVLAPTASEALAQTAGRTLFSESFATMLASTYATEFIPGATLDFTSSSVSGSGSAGLTQVGNCELITGTTAGSTCRKTAFRRGMTGGTGNLLLVNFSRPVAVACTLNLRSTNATGRNRIWFGSTPTTSGANIGLGAARGFGWDIRGTRIWGQVHNGSAPAFVDSGIDFPDTSTAVRLCVYGDGSGTVLFSVNGTVVSSSGGPTGTTGTDNTLHIAATNDTASADVGMVLRTARLVAAL